MKITNIISPIIILGLGGFLWGYTASFPALEEGYPGPALFPRLIGLGLLISGGILLIQALRNTEQEGDKESGNVGLLLGGIALLLVYPVLRPIVGFFPSLLSIGVLIGLLFRVKIGWAVLTAVLTTSAIYIIFTILLKVAL